MIWHQTVSQFQNQSWVSRRLLEVVKINWLKPNARLKNKKEWLPNSTPKRTGYLNFWSPGLEERRKLDETTSEHVQIPPKYPRKGEIFVWKCRTKSKYWRTRLTHHPGKNLMLWLVNINKHPSDWLSSHLNPSANSGKEFSPTAAWWSAKKLRRRIQSQKRPCSQSSGCQTWHWTTEGTMWRRTRRKTRITKKFDQGNIFMSSVILLTLNDLEWPQMTFFRRQMARSLYGEINTKPTQSKELKNSKKPKRS